MTTDGGGWTLVLAYAHAGNANNVLRSGVRPTDPNNGYSHYSVSEMVALDPFSEARFYCTSSGHDRVMHFKTGVTGILDYLRGSGVNQYTWWNSDFTPLPGHTARLPAATFSANVSPGDAVMTDFPFYWGGQAYWTIRSIDPFLGGPPVRWECDDSSQPNGPSASDTGFQNTTVHQVWVR